MDNLISPLVQSIILRDFQPHYLSHYPSANFWVILLQRELPVGCLIVSEGPAQIYRVDIVLLPEYRRIGIGTRILRYLQQRAARSEKTISLHVEQINPALRLYQKLGFVVTGENGLHLQMRWKGAC
jgi:ribosomal protein S18 acetylase RimI-like enzyme